MSKKRAEPLAWAIIFAAVTGTAQVSMAQMNGVGGHGPMVGTNQYGALEFVGIAIGVAILILLVVLVAKKSRA